MASYRIEGLTFTYPGRDVPALTDIRLDIAAGDFVVLCGDSGGGKTTLLRHLKPSLTPHGEATGRVLFSGRDWAEVDASAQARSIGFVSQSPDNQIVTDKVWHELAFGLESLGMDQATMRLRVAEMAAFFGIEAWFERDVTSLSGGQKQLLNLAGVMALQPEVLILDEPTSQLDPIAASDFLAAVKRINAELGVTVVLSEHRLEEAFPLADRVVVLRGGRVVNSGPPEVVCAQVLSDDRSMVPSLPTAARLFGELGGGGACPLTVRDGRRYLLGRAPEPLRRDREPGQGAGRLTLRDRRPVRPALAEGRPALELDEVWFRYEKKDADVLRGMSLVVPSGSLTALMGGNGAGKSTALAVMAGLREPFAGRVAVDGRRRSRGRAVPQRVRLLPQNPQAVFSAKTVALDLVQAVESGVGDSGRMERVEAMAERLGIAPLLRMHPYDLSGGEQQRAALAKVLLTEPDILLLDEPTKGLDAAFKASLAGIFARLIGDGLTLVMASHDVEFCAAHADRCALLFRGAVVAEEEPGAFFAGHSFYTTAANRIARSHWPEAITVTEVARLCRAAP